MELELTFYIKPTFNKQTLKTKKQVKFYPQKINHRCDLKS
jgi:hypothetical protein